MVLPKGNNWRIFWSQGRQNMQWWEVGKQHYHFPAWISLCSTATNGHLGPTQNLKQDHSKPLFQMRGWKITNTKEVRKSFCKWTWQEKVLGQGMAGQGKGGGVEKEREWNQWLFTFYTEALCGGWVRYWNAQWSIVPYIKIVFVANYFVIWSPLLCLRQPRQWWRGGGEWRGCGTMNLTFFVTHRLCL